MWCLTLATNAIVTSYLRQKMLILMSLLVVRLRSRL